MRVKIRKDDTVEVISGRAQDKGRRGKVIKVLPEEGRIVVSGINIRKKHQKQTQSQGRTMKPGIIEFEAAMAIGNVMLVCPKCDKTTRVAIERTDGESKRLCKNCGKAID